MLRRISTLALGAPLLSLALLATQAATAQALTFAPCPNSSVAGFTCATLTVALNRSGAVPGTVTLNVERQQA
ncbi:MAG TPA: hypothetical protein VNU24_04510, partial [Solirubrobacteraceae bacterium]|nr:hypothetical protein [Solirubrobacteraceae bacterium]